MRALRTRPRCPLPPRRDGPATPPPPRPQPARRTPQPSARASNPRPEQACASREMRMRKWCRVVPTYRRRREVRRRRPQALHLPAVRQLRLVVAALARRLERMRVLESVAVPRAAAPPEPEPSGAGRCGLRCNRTRRSRRRRSRNWLLRCAGADGGGCGLGADPRGGVNDHPVDGFLVGGHEALPHLDHEQIAYTCEHIRCSSVCRIHSAEMYGAWLLDAHLAS